LTGVPPEFSAYRWLGREAPADGAVVEDPPLGFCAVLLPELLPHAVASMAMDANAAIALTRFERFTL
jgi:hypothetical protein